MEFDEFCNIFTKYDGANIIGCFQIYRDQLLKHPTMKLTLLDGAIWGLNQYIILVNDIFSVKLKNDKYEKNNENHTLSVTLPEEKEYIKIFFPINNKEIINMSKLESVVSVIEKEYQNDINNINNENKVELYAALYEVGDTTM